MKLWVLSAGGEEASRILARMLTEKNTISLSEIDLSAFVVIAADGATAVRMDIGCVPEVICTDLDGNSEANIEKEILACEQGSIILIHAHGDNIDKLKKYVPRFKRFFATTHARPFDKVFNFGGFSNRDRCVFVARILELRK